MNNCIITLFVSEKVSDAPINLPVINNIVYFCFSLKFHFEELAFLKDNFCYMIVYQNRQNIIDSVSALYTFNA